MLLDLKTSSFCEQGNEHSEDEKKRKRKGKQATAHTVNQGFVANCRLRANNYQLLALARIRTLISKWDVSVIRKSNHDTQKSISCMCVDWLQFKFKMMACKNIQ